MASSSFAATVQHADPRRSEHLVAAERHEIGVQRLDIDGAVRNTLCRVDQHQRTDRVGFGNDGGNGIHGSQHVGDFGDGHQARPRSEQIIQRLEHQAAVVGYRHESHGAASSFRQVAAKERYSSDAPFR